MSTIEIVIILDSSGSMSCIKDATVKGINDFVIEVRKSPGEGFWTLVQFDDHASAYGAKEEFPHVVFDRVPDSQLPEFTKDMFHPRGGTALIDACCIQLNKIKGRVKESNENNKVMVVIITDGEENSSKQFNRDQLRELTAELQQNGVEFLYLGANQDVFGESASYGIKQTSQDWSGLKVYGSGGGFSYTMGTNLNNALPMMYTPAGVAECMSSGSVGTRAWKADGNESAANMIIEPVNKFLASGEWQ